MRCLPPLWPRYSSGSCPQFMGESRQLESLALPYLLARRPKYKRLLEIESPRSKKCEGTIPGTVPSRQGTLPQRLSAGHVAPGTPGGTPGGPRLEGERPRA
jgi:hypothetical protein